MCGTTMSEGVRIDGRRRKRLLKIFEPTLFKLVDDSVLTGEQFIVSYSYHLFVLFVYID